MLETSVNSSGAPPAMMKNRNFELMIKFEIQMTQTAKLLCFSRCSRAMLKRTPGNLQVQNGHVAQWSQTIGSCYFLPSHLLSLLCLCVFASETETKEQVRDDDDDNLCERVFFGPYSEFSISETLPMRLEFNLLS